MAKSSQPFSQSAVIPLRRGAHGPEVLLVTSRDTGRWVLPKGFVKPGRSPGRSALEEAYEEAGVTGHLIGGRLGVYKYVKPELDGSGKCRVEVFLMRVTRILDRWPEKTQRKRRWMSPAKAAKRVDERKLRILLLRMASRFDALLT